MAGNVPIKAKGANSDINFDHHTYDNRVVRHDIFPNDPTTKPVGALRHDAPFEPSILIDWKGKRAIPTQDTKLKLTDPDFVPFIGVLTDQDRQRKLKTKGFRSSISIPEDGFVRVKSVSK